jgi:hypothetical protein
MKREAEENMSTRGRGGDKRVERHIHVAIAVQDGGICLTCTVRALYV